MISLSNHSGLLIFIIVCNILASVMIIMAYLCAPYSKSNEKLSAYECGFEPFTDARQNFDIHFYIVAILFIIFDLEVAFLVPWSINILAFGQTGIFSMVFFLSVLTVGFVYEWRSGALDWNTVQ